MLHKRRYIAKVPVATSKLLGSTDYQNIVVTSPSGSNKVLAIGRRPSSPYLYAAEYDPSTDIWTDLTISGALPGDLSNDLQAEYITSTSTIYLRYDTTSTGSSRMYPLTLSGTTLTIGSSIDISAQIPNSASNYEGSKTRMTGDGTYLYFYNLYAGALKRFNPSGSTWTTLATPEAATTGYVNCYQWAFAYSDGNIYMFRWALDSNNSVYYAKHKKYNISGDSWSDLAIPPYTLSFQGALNVGTGVSIMRDPADDSYMFYIIGQYIFEYTPATQAWVYCGPGYSASQFTSIGAGAGNTQFPHSQLMNISAGLMFFSSGYSSYSGYLYEVGDNLVSGNAFGNLPSAGVLKGIQSNNYSNYPRINQYSTQGLFISIDGGAYERMDMQYATTPIEQQNLNIRWTSSLKIKSFGLSDSEMLIMYEDHS